MLSSKPPDKPGVRFSCSPKIWDRSDVRSSASDTALAFLLVTLNCTSPAVTVAGLGAQPCGVRVMLTVVVLPVSAAVLDLPDPELEQPAMITAAPVTRAARAVMRGVLPRRVPRRPSVLTRYCSFDINGMVLSQRRTLGQGRTL